MTDLDEKAPAPAPTSAPPAPEVEAAPLPRFTPPADPDGEYTVPWWLVVLLFLATVAGCVAVALIPRGG